jgi:hypothetical protein
LGRKGVDLADGLSDVEIFAALNLTEIRGSLVEGGGEILGRGQHRLASVQIAWVGGELRKTVEKRGEGRLQPGAGSFVEQGLDLLAGADEGVEASLLLRFLIDAKIEDGVAEAGDLTDVDAGAEGQIADLYGRVVIEVGDLARIAGSVDVGDVVGGGLDGGLLGLERLRCDVEACGESTHG